MHQMENIATAAEFGALSRQSYAGLVSVTISIKCSIFWI